MFPGTDCLLTKLTLDNLEAVGDFLVVHRGAIAAQEKFGDVGRDRILSLEFAHEILAHHVALKGFCGNRIDGVQLLAHQVILQVWWIVNGSPAPKHPAKRSRHLCRCRNHFRGIPSPCLRVLFRAPACPPVAKCSGRIGWSGHPRGRPHNAHRPRLGILPRSTSLRGFGPNRSSDSLLSREARVSPFPGVTRRRGNTPWRRGNTQRLAGSLSRLPDSNAT